jgi:electron transfer flavoprotein-quinone oxidoreductase
MAHLLPEGGFKAIPPLYTDGMLIAGDAAHLFNKMHREGSNLAIISGSLAAKTIIKAKEKNDFSSASLSNYQKFLGESCVIKDLKKYQNVPEYFRKHHHLFSHYPELANFVLKEILTVDGKTKKEKQKLIMKKALEKRSVFGYLSDMWGGWRAFW